MLNVELISEVVFALVCQESIALKLNHKKHKKWLKTRRKRKHMMPLVMMNMGERYTIYKIGGKEETKKFLESLGFVTGGTVTVISEAGGNLIVDVKGSRIAIGRDMAAKIMVQ